MALPLASFNLNYLPQGTLGVRSSNYEFREIVILGTSLQITKPVSSGAGLCTLAPCHSYDLPDCCLWCHPALPPPRSVSGGAGLVILPLTQTLRGCRSEKGRKGERGSWNAEKASVKSRERNPWQSRKCSSRPNLFFRGRVLSPPPGCWLCCDSRKVPQPLERWGRS